MKKCSTCLLPLAEVAGLAAWHPGLSKEELHLPRALPLSVWARWWNRKRCCNAVMKKDAFALYMYKVSKKSWPHSTQFQFGLLGSSSILLAIFF